MREGKVIYVVLGMSLPWITSLLLVAVATYYCELFWLRLVCVVVAILNGNIEVRRAREEFRRSKGKMGEETGISKESKVSR